MSEAVDWWGVLEEAEQTVEQWPSWQQRYDADVFYGGSAAPSAGGDAGVPLPGCDQQRAAGADRRESGGE